MGCAKPEGVSMRKLPRRHEVPAPAEVLEGSLAARGGATAPPADHGLFEDDGAQDQRHFIELILEVATTPQPADSPTQQRNCMLGREAVELHLVAGLPLTEAAREARNSQMRRDGLTIDHLTSEQLDAYASLHCIGTPSKSTMLRRIDFALGRVRDVLDRQSWWHLLDGRLDPDRTGNYPVLPASPTLRRTVPRANVHQLRLW